MSDTTEKSEINKPTKALNDVVVTQAPAYIRELIKDVGMTIPIAKAFDAIEALILEAQRNVVTTTAERADLPAVITSIDHLLKHFRLFRDQGKVDIARRDAQSSNR